ncbi:MAG TPA: hypothetical protein VMG99_05050 [Thermoplasmata archaeon]|jgi:hypothetical protein|nr:hypothetical protein [Thermoplasmata archaeon]
MAAAFPDTPRPICPHCKQGLDPKTDILWENTASPISLRGVTIVYCGWCGSVLGSTGYQSLSKTRRG